MGSLPENGPDAKPRVRFRGKENSLMIHAREMLDTRPASAAMDASSLVECTEACLGEEGDKRSGLVRLEDAESSLARS